MVVEMSILGQMVDDVILAVEHKLPVYKYTTVKDVPETEIIMEKVKRILSGEEL